MPPPKGEGPVGFFAEKTLILVIAATGSYVVVSLAYALLRLVL